MDSSTSFVPLYAQNDSLRAKNNLHTGLVTQLTFTFCVIASKARTEKSVARAATQVEVALTFKTT